MLTPIWSIEHVYSHPAALSLFHRFRYLSVLSNAQDQYLSKCSLPNVQGEVYLSLPCPQPAVLHPCMCPSANMFLKSWLLKIASPMGIGLCPVLRIFGSRAKDYMNHFTFWCQRHDFMVRVFLNVFNHMYAILKNCYLFHCLSMPCPALLHFRMEKSFFLPHDFKAWMCKLSRKVFSSPINCLQVVAFNCFHLPS